MKTPEKHSVKGVEYEMVYIPPSEFWMGSAEDNKDAYDAEKPRHRVQLTKGYWLMRTPVTQALWEAVMGENPSHFKDADRPVENVSWYDAARFCNALSELEECSAVYDIGDGDKPEVAWNKEASGYRLPTEAEWECAAKAGTELKYSGSDTLDEVGWYMGNFSGGTQPVGKRRANAWGLFDMSGNVWEWCWDWWSAGYPEGTVSDPEGLNTGFRRVIRGGSWYDYAQAARSAYRRKDDPALRYSHLGLRPARTAD